MGENTTERKKMQVGEELRLLTGIVDSMEAAGIRIISAMASRDPYVLAFTVSEALRKWAADNELDVKVERLETEANIITGLRWTLTTEISGVEIRAYMSDEEKEAWDAE